MSVTAITGSSGSGASPSVITHHPTRHANLKAYKPFTHQHVPEIEQILDSLAGGKSMKLSLIPISGPFARGIHATVQATLRTPCDSAQVLAALREFYAGAPFVRL